MKEILCARLPAALRCPDLARSRAFYIEAWGFATVQHIPGVFAVLRRESVTVQLWQCRADETMENVACRLLVDDIDAWRHGAVSAPGQPAHRVTAPGWGVERAITDCDGNRLLLVQSAPHAARRRLRA